MRSKTVVAFLLFVCLVAFAQVKEKGPDWALKFTDFAAAESFHGKPAKPILATAGQRMFRTAIRDAAAKGPNFAGHYTIAQWGCGSGCVSFVVVDAVSGKVFPAPFEMLGMPLADVEGGPEYQAAVYRLKSRLLIADGCPDDAKCGAYYYEWSDNKFKQLRLDTARKNLPRRTYNHKGHEGTRSGACNVAMTTFVKLRALRG